MSTPEFVTDTTRLLDRLRQQADAVAAKASGWLAKLTDAKAQLAAAEANFVDDFSADAAASVARAQSAVRDLSAVSAAIENAGGVSEVRKRALSTPAVFSSLAKAFGERVDALNKLLPEVRKRLGARRAQLTDEGVSFPEIEGDSLIVALRDFEGHLAREIAAATFAQKYADRRGEGHARRSFDELYSVLTHALPQAPAVRAS
jgi:hypothetical protein